MLDSRVGRPPAGIRAVPVLDIGHLLRRLDWLMLGAVAALLAYGLWLLNGITRDDVPGDPTYYIRRQLVYAVIGVVGLVLAVFVNPDVYRRRRMVIYVTLIGSLLLVLAGGVSARGSQRWISLGSFRFQPSEFGKLLLVLCLAGVPRRPRQAGGARCGRRSPPIGIAAVADRARLPAAGRRQRARLRRRARRRALRGGDALAAPRRPARGRGDHRHRRPLGGARGRGGHPQAVPGAAPHVVHATRRRIRAARPTT